MDLNTFTTGNPNIDKWIHLALVFVTLASVLANIVPANTKVGQLLHWIAFNFNKQALAADKKDTAGVPGTAVTAKADAIATGSPLPMILIGLVLLTGCAALTRAATASPACHGLEISDVVKADVGFISTVVADISTGNYFAILDAFGAARGPAFQCELEMAEALLSKPVPAAPTLEANMALTRALAMNPSAQLGALQRLANYRAARGVGR